MSGTIANFDPNRTIDPDAIAHFAEQVIDRFNPEQIILFGSYAYGDPTPDSDVDLLIVMPHRGPGHRLATRIRLAIPVTFPMDLLVRSAAELRKSIREQEWFIVEILEKGIVLHDHSDAAVGAKGRGRLRRRGDYASISY